MTSFAAKYAFAFEDSDQDDDDIDVQIPSSKPQINQIVNI
jgi:hypothetical protein